MKKTRFTPAEEPTRIASPEDGPHKKRAPWTEDEVASLNAYQESPHHHPFTSMAGGTLFATKEGWVEQERSGKGKVVQDWAHEWMADWTWRDGRKRSEGKGEERSENPKTKEEVFDALGKLVSDPVVMMWGEKYVVGRWVDLGETSEGVILKSEKRGVEVVGEGGSLQEAWETASERLHTSMKKKESDE